MLISDRGYPSNAMLIKLINDDMAFLTQLRRKAPSFRAERTSTAAFARMNRRLKTNDGGTGAAVAFKGFGKRHHFVKLL